MKYVNIVSNSNNENVEILISLTLDLTLDHKLYLS